MNLKSQRRIAAKLLKAGLKRIKFDNEKLSDIKEAITKNDVRNLIRKKNIRKKALVGVSRVRARKRIKQKRKGRRSGEGSRKGKRTARLTGKRGWINRIRVQRELIKNLRKKGKLEAKDYRNLYLKIKGGFFRSKRHIKLYLEEHSLVKK